MIYNFKHRPKQPNIPNVFKNSPAL